MSTIDGIIFANDKVPDAFVAHYEAFLGQTGYTNGFDGSNLFSNCLDEQGAAHMVRMVTDREIKDAMFSMGDEKSPGPDGFSAAFFKEAWHIVGVDVINAIREFFTNGKLLKELNHTIIALIPKLSKVRTKWRDACVSSKDEGGLGIRRWCIYNSALLPSAFHSGYSFGGKIGNVLSTSFWFDNGVMRGLASRVSLETYMVGLTLFSHVGDVFLDVVSIWDIQMCWDLTCPLCEATPDSHEHLFFICPFANSVWSRMKVKAGLVVAASAYFIWQERNWRLFKKSKRSIDQELLVQRFAAIMGYREKMWEMSIDVEELGCEVARLGVAKKCCLGLVVPRVEEETKRRMWSLGDQAVEELGCEVARLGVAKKCCLGLVVPRVEEETKRRMWSLGDQLWTVPLEMPPGSTFIASRFLTYPSAHLVVVICGTPTVTGQMANSVALVAFGRSWNIV
ncbi:hypothetical protein Tco_1042388, partial [Tanacetum coccineum]